MIAVEWIMARWTDGTFSLTGWGWVSLCFAIGVAKA